MDPVAVDLNQCQGHGRCYSHAPEIFEPIDDHGRAGLVLGVHPNLDERLVSKVDTAIEICPERALS